MTPEQLKERTKRFALEVIALVGTLPRTLVAEIILRIGDGENPRLQAKDGVW